MYYLFIIIMPISLMLANNTLQSPLIFMLIVTQCHYVNDLLTCGETLDSQMVKLLYILQYTSI